jgi:hypothetical protein
VLYIVIAKVDRDGAHVVMSIQFVSIICSKCFTCSRLILQVFCLDVVKVDLYVAYIHACCKHMFQVFSGVSYVCLQVFHLDVAYVCNDF